MPETIAAQATSPGQGGIGIIRISGPLALLIAEKITAHKNLSPRKAIFTKFYDESDQVLDEGLLLYFPAPNSFTGDDVIELQLHGSPVIIDLLLQTCVYHGARLARPGEFSERAFHNGKIDLAQAEAIADLIESGTETAARMATRSLQGVFSKYIHELVEQLIHLRMYVEAAIDFPEEEIDFLSDGKVQNDLLRIINKLGEVIEKAKQGSLIKEGMTLVIAGQPNA
ncbi:MAG: tRNA uridine-5-carboxymethylaminomethyl(34) synthesis GTPase MnmE, partial [Gammaproteobacteria bacterium]|nr:tRNA uridine-5-carboxymethylaminomethyl(34) synthesis GTPase MnmE [Gammaproteobacteria bacterium]